MSDAVRRRIRKRAKKAGYTGAALDEYVDRILVKMQQKPKER